MTILVTGGTGFVGRFIVEELLESGHDVAIAGRSPPPAAFFSRAVAFRPLSLEPGEIDRSALAGLDALVHAAFHHVPGLYRGGEGSDPDGFRRLNLDGSAALFEAARDAGVRHCVFLSSRAVYGTQPAGKMLAEETEPHPATLYGEVKLEGERVLAGLAAPGFRTASLRVTGVYGPPPPGKPHKWETLFADWLSGRPVAPRCGTEVHGDDVAKAVRLVLESDRLRTAETFNVSDCLIDRCALLALVGEETGCRQPLPPAADSAGYNVMATDRLRALGWRPGGQPLFEAAVRQLARRFCRQWKAGPGESGRTA